MKQGLILVVLILFCSSCASVFNGKRSNVKIHSEQMVDLVVDGDTILRSDNNPVYLDVENRKRPMFITVLDSAGQGSLAVTPHKPATYWLNVIPVIYFAGFLVDEITGLKWRYPRNIYIQSQGNLYSYLPYLPMDSTLLERKNKITFAPFSLVLEYHPAVEFGYERLHGSRSATQLSLGFLRSWNNEYARNSRGIKASLEHKLFFRNQNKLRLYTALALEYLHKDHDADLSMEVIDSDGNAVFPFNRFVRRTTVQKRFIALTPRIGFQSYLTPRLVAEGFFGAGLRARDVTHENSVPFARHVGNFEWLLFNDEYVSNREIRNITINFDLNFRLAWTF